MSVFTPNMTQQTITSLRLSNQLLLAAQETARQQRESLSAVLRRYLEAYTAAQATAEAN